MDVNEFNNWKKQFKKIFPEFFDELDKLLYLYNSVWYTRNKGHDEISRYIKSDWKQFGRKEAWYNVDKLEKEIKRAEKKIAFLQNVMVASRPSFLPFLDYYEPARNKWNELITMLMRVRETIGITYTFHSR